MYPSGIRFQIIAYLSEYSFKILSLNLHLFKKKNDFGFIIHSGLKLKTLLSNSKNTIKFSSTTTLNIICYNFEFNNK